MNVEQAIVIGQKARKMRRQISKKIRPYNLSFNEFEILYVLYSIGEMMPSTIAVKTEQGNSSVSRILHSLLEKKFITIDADYLDRRSVFVKITEMGRELYSTVEKAIRSG